MENFDITLGDIFISESATKNTLRPFLAVRLLLLILYYQRNVIN